MTIKELLKLLAPFGDDIEIVVHDGEYTSVWDIEDVYLTKYGKVKISPFPNDRYNNDDSVEQSQESIDRHKLALSAMNKPGYLDH
jgi:hypothetical protein